jgi:hypothetical protein
MPDGKNRNHENTRKHTNQKHEIRIISSYYFFVLFLRVVSCIFVVNSFFIEHELTLSDITRSCSRVTKSARLG